MEDNDQKTESPAVELAPAGGWAPWVGKLRHDREEFADWGWIRDETGALIMTVKTPHSIEADEHRRNKTDPTQPRVDAILASVNAIDAIRSLCTTDHESKEAFIRRVLLCLPNNKVRDAAESGPAKHK